MRERIVRALSAVVSLMRRGGAAIAEWNRRSENRYPNRREQLRQVRQSVAVSLRHNLPLTVAGILCSAVALCLVGSSLVVSNGVSNATVRWRGGVETIVFLDPAAPESVVQAIGSELKAAEIVERVEFVSQEEAYKEFSEMFRTSPELVRSVGPEALPASWRIVPEKGTDESAVDALGESFEGRDGVYQVVYAREAVQSVLMVSRTVRVALNLLALFLGGAALLLSLASCRAAAWARRDELAVMRLVGAGRWLVRLPFAIEGAVQGLIGGVLASFGVWRLADYIQERVSDGNSLAILRAFNVSTGERIHVAMLLIGIGVIGGALGASVAVGRYARAREGLPSNLVLRTIAQVQMGVKRHQSRRQDTAVTIDVTQTGDDSANGEMHPLDETEPATTTAP